MTEAKKVKPFEWKVFVSMLIIVWGMSVFDILDNISSILATLGISICFIFKEHFVDSNINLCFLDDVINFEIHEKYIEYFNRTRWETLLLFILSIIGLRIASIFEYIVFTSSMATIMIIFGLLYCFFPEAREYYRHFRRTNSITKCEDKEIELINSIYGSRAVFSGTILGLFLFCLSIKHITDTFQSTIVYLLIIIVIYFTYKISINSKIRMLSNSIFKNSSRKATKHECSY